MATFGKGTVSKNPATAAEWNIWAVPGILERSGLRLDLSYDTLLKGLNLDTENLAVTGFFIYITRYEYL